MQGIKKLEIEISEWPTLEDLKEFTNPEEKHTVIEYLQEEYDSFVSFRAGGVDLLANYPEAFILPIHAFCKSLGQGLRALAETKEARVPIYLQQYQVEEGCRSHFLTWRLEDGYVYMGFEWGGFKESPAFLKELGEIKLVASQLQGAIADLLGDYINKVILLLRQLEGWTAEDMDELFEGF